ncbi:hypothetical protein P43SY_010103 [Pythium insidiosum]|uniref:N-acetylated-alpha-linked acidic dipeptidase-like protein n=1 Tax=Pythium insidiosum TaxID=114742 RepID=A0AAD5QD68_PYTIN|nr:hypothetical protein P43SY_010103 [Pythium insidiosum]
MAGGNKVVAEDEKASIRKNDSLLQQQQRGSLKLELERPATGVDDDEGDDDDERPILAPNLYMDSPRIPRIDDDVSDDEKRRRKLVGVATLLGLFLSVLLCVVFLHYLSHHESFSALPPTQHRLMAATSTKGAKETLEQYTAGYRQTGSAGDQEMAKFIRSKAIDFGIEDRFIKIEEFQILTNEPETLKIEIPRKTGAPSQVFDLTASYRVAATKNQRASLPPFHMYARNGTASGPIVYAHYGRSQDYAALSKAGVDISGCIALVRMGEISLPAKIVLAGRHGAVGVVTYNDPFDDGEARGKTYPDGPWRSSDEASFGSVYMGNGDPSTPDGFSASEADRITVDEVFSTNNTYNLLPPVVSLPVSAKHASELLQTVTDTAYKTASQVFPNWSGGALRGATYRVGQGSVKVKIDNANKYTIKKVWNVLITIRGSREADRYIIVGAPRDALYAGASSPGSGNVVFIELLRAVGDLLTNGWVPHRTLLLASFDGEQYGSVGSSEWIDRHFSHLGGRGVAYLHLRDVVRGAGALHCEAAASLRKTVYLMSTEIVQPKPEVAVQSFFSANGGTLTTPAPTTKASTHHRVLVADPTKPDGVSVDQETTPVDDEVEISSLLPLNSTFKHEDLKDSGDSVYSFWLAHTRSRSPSAKIPKITLPGADKKISPFLARLGIPSVELGFDGGYFGVENSRNDSADWLKRFADPGFTYHRAAAQLYGSVLLQLSDSIFLQYDFTEVARDLRYGEAYLNEALQREAPGVKLPMQRLATSIAEFEQAALLVTKEIHEMADQMVNLISGELVVDLKRVREMNTRLLMTEKTFLLPAGLPHMPWLKHALYGISEYDDYRVGYFPGVTHEIKTGTVVSMKRELIRLCQTIEQAADILSTPVL